MTCAVIGPKFFGYLEDIATQLTARGRPATYYDERPSNKVSHKLFIRFAPQSLRARALAQHIEQLTAKVIADGVTHVLLVSPEVITTDAVKAWQAAGIHVTMYLWDAVRNKPRSAALVPLVSRVASFDPVDCAQHGFVDIPLYSAAPREDPAPAKTHDVFYCTTLHSNRPQLLTRLRKALSDNNWSSNLLLFYHSKPLWLVRYARNPEVWPLLPLISTTSFAQSDIAAATQRARVVFDIHHAAQSGLTMRTFEVLSLDTVLLTTNPLVLDQLPEALHDHIVPLDLDDLSGSLNRALDRRPEPLGADVLYALSIQRFLDQIEAFMEGAPVAATFPPHKT